jgi:nicotinamide mononucleotide transporter
MNPYETAAFVFGVAAVYLTVRENVWCWPLGLVNVVLSMIVFRQARLYADMGLQGVYVLLCLYGWHAWLRGGPGRGLLAVSPTPRWALTVLPVLGLGGSFLLGLGLARYTGAAVPYWDSSTTAFSLVAQYMQTRKWLENWLVWIAVDLVYLGIYVYKSLYLMTGLYAIFLVLAVLGWREWRRSQTAASA